MYCIISVTEMIYTKAGFTCKKSGGKHKDATPRDNNQKSISEAFNLVTKFPASSSKSKELTNAVAYFIAKDMQPISVVQGVGFRHMIGKLEPRYLVPHRKTFTERVLPDHFVKLKDTVTSVVNNVSSFAITTDCWTSRANEAYMGVTIHTITDDWELAHFTLQNRPLPDQHTAENLAEALLAVLQDWNLDPAHFTCAVVDNAANVQKAVIDILSWNCLGCFGHTLNLCVKAGLKVHQISTAIARCSRLVTYFRKSSRAAHILSEKQDLLGIEKHKLLNDVDTRWNSTYDMVQRVLEQQSPICSSLVDQKRLDLLPKDAELHILEELVQVLKPFKEITVQVSAEAYVTSSAINPLLHHIINNILKIQLDDSATIQKMKSEMKKNIQSRYKKDCIVDMLNTACFVDARFKSMPFLSKPEIKTLHNDIVEEMLSLMPPPTNEEQSTGSDNSVTDGQEPAVKKKKTLLGQILGDMFEKQNEEGIFLSNNEKAEQELKRYVDEDSPAVDETHALKWWKEHHHRFPYIAKIAKRLLCIPATSTPSERLFSTAGHIINSKRACLDPDNVNMLCFLAENLP